MNLYYKLPDITDLKKAREAVGLTQKQLEKLSGISQSIISKVEQGLRIPRYDTAVRLFTAISDYMESQTKDDTRKASEIMTKRVKSFQVTATVGEVIKTMKLRDISQFPVYNVDDLVGTVTERSLLGAQPDYYLKDYLVDPLPIFPQNTRVGDLEKILKMYSAVLLSDNSGKIVGICSRQDILPG